MMTVHEVSKISGVSIRALHHYDKIGLLPATKVTDARYRLYDDTALRTTVGSDPIKIIHTSVGKNQQKKILKDFNHRSPLLFISIGSL